MVTEISTRPPGTGWDQGGEWLGKGIRTLWGIRHPLYFDGMWVTQVYVLVKTPWMVLLRFVHFIVHKLYLNFKKYDEENGALRANDRGISNQGTHITCCFLVFAHWGHFLKGLASSLPLLTLGLEKDRLSSLCQNAFLSARREIREEKQVRV